MELLVSGLVREGTDARQPVTVQRRLKIEAAEGTSRGLGYKSSIQTAKQKVEGDAINTCQWWKIVAQWCLTPTAAKVRRTPGLK